MGAPFIQQVYALQTELEHVSTPLSRDQLLQCARLLATYVSLYKHEFGELSAAQYDRLNERIGHNQEFGESVYLAGMHELLETLALVGNGRVDEGRESAPGPGRLLN